MSELVEVAKSGNAERVKALLEGVADPDIQDRNGMTALEVAVSYGHTESVKALLEGPTSRQTEGLHSLGAYPDIRGGRNGETALMSAASSGNEDCVKQLPDAGVDPLISDNDGKTTAEHSKNKEIRRTLEKMINSVRLQGQGIVVFVGGL